MSDNEAKPIQSSSEPDPVAPPPSADPKAQAAADALMAQAHIRANFAAKAFVEALSAVGEGARVVTPRGLATISDVRAHGPLVVIDGFVFKAAGGTEPYRAAVHPSALNMTIVLPQGEG